MRDPTHLASCKGLQLTFLSTVSAPGDKESIVKYSELELRYARPVAEAILHNRDFCCWLLQGTKYENATTGAKFLGELQRSLRSPTMKNPWWFNYWCGKDSKCACRIGTGIETDVLLICEYAADRRLALHLEIKRPGDHLGHGQAESYARRAACWANAATRPRTVPPHQDFLTIPICGRDLAGDPRLQLFDKFVFHDMIAEKIAPYPEA